MLYCSEREPETRTAKWSLNVGVTAHFFLGARCCHSAVARRPDIPREARERPCSKLWRLWFPSALAFSELGVAELNTDRSALRVDRNDVAVLQQADRTRLCRFRTHMTNAKTAS